MKDLPRHLFMVVAICLIASVVGCANIVDYGDKKVNTCPTWQYLLVIVIAVAGTATCWFCRHLSALNWIGIVGLPLFAVFILFGFARLSATVDQEHFQVSTAMGVIINEKFEGITSMKVVKERTGVYKRGTEIVVGDAESQPPFPGPWTLHAVVRPPVRPLVPTDPGLAMVH